MNAYAYLWTENFPCHTVILVLWPKQYTSLPQTKPRVNLYIQLCNEISLSYRIHALKKKILWQFSRIHRAYYFNIRNDIILWITKKSIVCIHSTYRKPLYLCQHWRISENYVEYKCSVNNSEDAFHEDKKDLSSCTTQGPSVFIKTPMVLLELWL